MTVTSIFLIGMKSLIVLIPLLIIIRLGLTNTMVQTITCDKDARMEFEHCAMKLLEFGDDYRSWESVNFPSHDLPTIMKLKRQCEQIPKCFNSVAPGCQSEVPLMENFPVWCRRVYFFSGEFAKCAGKVNQISGSVKCANEFFEVDFIEQPKNIKCQIMNDNKACILESVTKTCANVMADVLRIHLNTEQILIKC